MIYKTILKFLDIETEKTFLGPLNKNLTIIRDELNVKLAHINDALVVDENDDFEICQEVVELLYELCLNKINYQERDIVYIINRFVNSNDYDATKKSILGFYKKKDVLVNTYDGRKITAKTIMQQEYIKAMEQSNVIFATGSAGTGKTYLAVGFAVNLMKNNKIKKIIITRPAVEAGEKLGFLPGDLKEKVDPYLIPIYDSLYEFLGKENTDKLIEKGVIEIAPLAYMRGRTLDNAIIILDEGQNATSSQMKMFVTRLGFNSKMIITGDITQIDLPNKNQSGLVEAITILSDIPGIKHIEFGSLDVMRHPIVSKIIAKYEEYEK